MTELQKRLGISVSIPSESEAGPVDELNDKELLELSSRVASKMNITTHRETDLVQVYHICCLGTGSFQLSLADPQQVC